MASDPDRNKDPNNSSSAASSKSDNPFIRFRQFADEQISSLLRGVIGLPSTFERGQNPRWAEFDEDLRRRDELQARQHQLKESEARRAFQRESEERAEMPVKRYRDDRIPLPQMNERTARDLPLFSPVHKSLFNHLEKRGDNATDWDPSCAFKSFKRGLLPQYYPYALLPEQHSPDFMRIMQYFIYNDLNAEPFMRSEYSLLPYLLFSPYSPLKLSVDKSSVSPYQNESILDKFPYCAAFEDLIHETIDPNTTRSSFPTWQRPHKNNEVQAGMEWIQNLHYGNLLQQREHINIRDVVCWPSPSSSPTFENARKLLSTAGTPETEQDFYERFLLPPARMPETLGSLFSDVESFIEKKLKALDSPEGKQAFQDFLDSKLAKEIFEMLKATKEMEKPSDLKESSRDAEPAAPLQTPTTPSQEKSKLVATSTSSERNVEEDGSVETIVTVWKRFADGRESTTITSRFEDAGGWKDKDSEENKQEVKAEREPEEKKKGWFWN